MIVSNNMAIDALDELNKQIFRENVGEVVTPPAVKDHQKKWEKELDKLYTEEFVVCSKCKHAKESHWWNGGGRVENSGYLR